jgi:hypothetical protein
MALVMRLEGKPWKFACRARLDSVTFRNISMHLHATERSQMRICQWGHSFCKQQPKPTKFWHRFAVRSRNLLSFIGSSQTLAVSAVCTWGRKLIGWPERCYPIILASPTMRWQTRWCIVCRLERCNSTLQYINIYLYWSRRFEFRPTFWQWGGGMKRAGNESWSEVWEEHWKCEPNTTIFLRL